jgi:tripartite-type tricarboxylate transporter receptor subunit TctC
MLVRRHVVLGAGALAATGVLGTTLLRAQQQYPTKLVTIVIPNGPGGEDDTLTRFIADLIKTDLGQPVLIDNRGGGSTSIGGLAVARSEPDGYTLLCVPMSAIVQTVLRERLQYSMKSFVPIVGIGSYPMALVVSPKTGIANFDDLKAAAAKGDGVTYATAGVGTLAQMTAVRFLKAIEGKGVHVPYKNNPEGLQGLAGGFTDMMFAGAREAASLSKNGTVHVLAVTSKVRANVLPDTPTMTELGLPQIDPQLWFGYVAPAGTPPEIVDRLAEVIEKAVKSPSFAERFQSQSFQTNVMKGEPLQHFIDTQAARYREVIVENNIKVGD